MKQVKLLAGSLLALSLLAGCNTVRGVGKDLQAGGKAISETSDEVKDYLTAPAEPGRTASACDPAGPELKGRSDLPPCK